MTPSPKADRTDDGWIVWNGGKRPVPPDAVVQVRFRDSVECHECSTAGYWDGFGQPGASCWEHDEGEPCSDIIAYRVVQP